MLETKSGIIKTVMLTRQYGFLYQEDGTTMFFHKSGVVKPEFEELREGMPVDYMVVDCPTGKKAIGLVVA